MDKSIRRLNPLLFSWNNWRSGTIHDLGVQCRSIDILSERGKRILINATVGYCEGDKLQCRPKKDHVAIMCFKNGIHFWFHLRENEFNNIFIK